MSVALFRQPPPLVRDFLKLVFELFGFCRCRMPVTLVRFGEEFRCGGWHEVRPVDTPMATHHRRIFGLVPNPATL
jgi:hypothetical protein